MCFESMLKISSLTHIVRRLSASHILCFFEPIATVCARYFDKQSLNIRILFEQVKSHRTHFSTVTGLSEEVKNTMRNLIEVDTNSWN